MRLVKLSTLSMALLLVSTVLGCMAGEPDGTAEPASQGANEAPAVPPQPVTTGDLGTVATPEVEPPLAAALDTSFVVVFRHGGGTAALGAQTSGSIAWFNRSLSLTNVKLVIHAGECARVRATAYFRNIESWYAVETKTSVLTCNGGTVAMTVDVVDIGFDCGSIVGGCGKVQIYALDDGGINDVSTHGFAENDYFR